eukprot:TRINITY_DN15931_c0_g1_i1.p1 TRINITY_DN15931_c0_g1~~TRINITY_DN15931_c0_g1_i1.p1  ORF type:complete len:137 (-),score=8.25 TRINITY_DN15931_c0_g1_i1:10-369(-)
MFVVGGIGFAGYMFNSFMLSLGILLWWHLLLIYLGYVILIFGLQLIGHWLHEDFESPIFPWHGFVAAPPLEYMALLHRIFRNKYEQVWKEVEDMRRQASTKNTMFDHTATIDITPLHTS